MLTEPTVVGPAKSDRTRTAIVDAALALFTEQGFDVTTVRQIAARAGVSVGNAYYYFDSKEQLVLSIYEQFAKTTVEPVLDSVAKGATPLPRVRRRCQGCDADGTHRAGDVDLVEGDAAVSIVCGSDVPQRRRSGIGDVPARSGLGSGARTVLRDLADRSHPSNRYNGSR